MLLSVGRPLGSHNPDNDVYDPGGDHALCHIRVPGKHQLYCTLLENVTNETLMLSSMQGCEQITQVAHEKRVTVSESLWSLMTKERP